MHHHKNVQFTIKHRLSTERRRKRERGNKDFKKNMYEAQHNKQSGWQAIFIQSYVYAKRLLCNTILIHHSIMLIITNDYVLDRFSFYLFSKHYLALNNMEKFNWQRLYLNKMAWCKTVN